MLEQLNEVLSGIINYELGLWNRDIVFPYWVGEFQEIEYSSESGKTEYSFQLVGTSRNNLAKLLEDKEKIQRLFSYYSATLENGHTLAIYYDNAMMIPSQDAQIRRLQINLTIMEWRNY